MREKVTELISQNDDLSKIVSDLSRAHYRMKLAAEKVEELHAILKAEDKQFEEKIEMTTGEKISEKLLEKLQDK
ncbi:MAG: hypothetical protein WCJ81_06505 [bacterium]